MAQLHRPVVRISRQYPPCRCVRVQLQHVAQVFAGQILGDDLVAGPHPTHWSRAVSDNGGHPLKTSAACRRPRDACTPTAVSQPVCRRPSRQVLVEPVQHVLPRLLGGLGVVALAGVIEERMAGSGEGTNFV